MIKTIVAKNKIIEIATPNTEDFVKIESFDGTGRAEYFDLGDWYKFAEINTPNVFIICGMVKNKRVRVITEDGEITCYQGNRSEVGADIING